MFLNPHCIHCPADSQAGISRAPIFFPARLIGTPYARAAQSTGKYYITSVQRSLTLSVYVPVQKKYIVNFETVSSLPVVCRLGKIYLRRTCIEFKKSTENININYGINYCTYLFKVTSSNKLNLNCNQKRINKCWSLYRVSGN